jgi:FkbM family methyltransferase
MKKLFRPIINPLWDLSIHLYHRFTWRLKEFEREWYDKIPSRGYYFLRLRTSEQPFNMLLTLPGQIENTIAKTKQYEPHIMSSIYSFMREDGVFLDIGANIGIHALYTAASFKNSKTICFEPHPTIYRELRRNIQLNPRLDNIWATDVALGDRCGKSKFYMQLDSCYNRGLSSLQCNYDLVEGVREVEVEVTTLDNYLDEASKENVSIIKMDTQGSEYEVICGAIETIEKSKPIIIFEFVSDYSSEPETLIRNIMGKLEA